MARRWRLSFLLAISLALASCGDGEVTASWIVQREPLIPLRDVEFVDATNGWAVDWRGDILHTKDSGITWQVQYHQTNTDLEVLEFVDATNGWAIGWNGAMLHTNDGGITWQPQHSGIGRDLQDVHFVDTNTGWILADDGTIIQTNDGGIAWRTIQVTTDTAVLSGINSIHFVDATTGWATGGLNNAISILQTGDGGITWQVQNSGSVAGARAWVWADSQGGLSNTEYVATAQEIESAGIEVALQDGPRHNLSHSRRWR